MNVSEYFLTENKKNKDNQNSKNKKDILSDIKQNLYQELTTQSSLKLKYRDYDESSFKNSKYINYFNLKNNEDNSITDFKYNKEEKDKYNKNNKERNNDNISENKTRRNDNNYMDDMSKSQNQNKKIINNSNMKLNNNYFDNFNNNEDLIYILTSKQNDNYKETEEQSEKDNYDKDTAYIALPFCHYHKYNLKLPKKYTCNFKNCSCCAVKEQNNCSNLENDPNNYKNNKDYIYPKFESGNKNNTYKSVLGKYKNKNKNLNLDKTKLSDSSEFDSLGDSGFNFMKPNNNNIKIPKNDYISEKKSENSENSENSEKSEKTQKSEKSEKSENSKDESSNLELPYDVNINDDKDLKKYKNLVDRSEKKSKIHFSVMYYKRLNKSFNQIFSKDINKNLFKNNIKNKNVELLRE